MAAILANASIQKGATLGNGANITLNSLGAVNTTAPESQVFLSIDNIGQGIVTNGANLAVIAGADFTTDRSGSYNLEITNRGSGSRIVTGANITSKIIGNLFTGFVNTIIDNTQGGRIDTGGNIDWTVTGNVNVTNGGNFYVLNSKPGFVTGSIGSSVSVNIRANSFTFGRDVNAYVENGGGTIGAGGNDFTLTLQSTAGISVTGRMNVFGTVNAGANVSAGTLAVTDLTTTGSITSGTGGIARFTIPSEPFLQIAHVLNGGTVTSQGGIRFDGDASFLGNPPTDGGKLTINTTALNLGTDIVGPVTFNGGDGGASPGASGGSFTINTVGDLTVSVAVNATTGLQDQALAPSGNGGNVSLDSKQGTVSITAPVKVSSADPTSSASIPPPRRRSNSGGQINVRSGIAGPVGGSGPTTVAINIGNSGQLLSLLDSAATGPGGKITILATGANTDINVAGVTSGVATDTIAADRGGVDIRHSGSGGRINLNSAIIRGDVVKIAALGSGGSLNIGGGTITADTVLKLYATGSNGQINFISNVSLNGLAVKTLAANRINILSGVLVTIGGGKPINVFTNNANYFGFGGTGNSSTTGTFGGAGAANPQPLSSAPLLDPPGGP